MRFLQILSCVSTVNAFNFFSKLPKLFQQKAQESCTVYTVVQYPCAISTWVPSNTVLWIDACSTTVNVSNAPTLVSTALTSTTTVGVPSTSTTTVLVSLQTTSTTTITLPRPSSSGGGNPTSPPWSPPTTPTNPTIPGNSPTGTSLIATGCIPSSTSYPNADYIPDNTKYIIQVTSPEITTQMAGEPVFLTKQGGITINPEAAVQIFISDDILFALDPNFGVGWFATDLNTNNSTFALRQYSSSSQLIARTFTTNGTSPIQLVWENCQFGNPTAVWALNVVDGLVSTWFSGTPGPVSDVEVVTLILVPPPAPTSTSTSALLPSATATTPP